VSSLLCEDGMTERGILIQLPVFELIPCVSKAELGVELGRKVAKMHSLGCNDEASNHSLHACMRRSSLVTSCMQRDRVSRTASCCNRTRL
jgi:hypothetical protein